MLMMLMLLAAPPRVQAEAPLPCAGSALDVEAQRLLGGTESLCEAHAGKVLLVVNTASQCGYTGQFKGLQALYERYAERGLVVLGFPSGDFRNQEFDDAEQIAEFCQINYGVSFPMYARAPVSGEAAQPLFARLIAESGEAPRWNFHKYLLDRHGKVVAVYPSRVKPGDRRLRADVERLLAQ